MNIVDPLLTDRERFPSLSDRGLQFLRELREDPQGPLWYRSSGDRITPEMLERMRQFAGQLRQPRLDWQPGTVPDWVREHAAFCLRTVPFYRKQGGSPERFFDLPSCSRADLAHAPWDFVPDGLSVADMIVYRTSGTTGHPAQVPADPESCGKYLPLVEYFLERHGITLERGRGRMPLLHVVAYEQARTGPLVLSYLDEAAFARINLLPSAWRDPDDCVRFLNRWRPPVYTADPVAFEVLSRLPLDYRPQALVSSSVTMTPAFQSALRDHFGCPVLDLYTLYEGGIVAGLGQHGFEVLPHDLYVEVLDGDDANCPPGVRGEIALTGGRNPFLPLLRYRTGDWASLECHDGQPVLTGFEGRADVRFRAADGRSISSLEITRILHEFPIVRYEFHQNADGSIRLRVQGSKLELEALTGELLTLFGAGQQLEITQLPPAGPPGKFRPFSSDIQDGV